MKIIILIPHYYKPRLLGQNSSRTFRKLRRLKAVKESINALEAGFINPALKINFETLLANVHPNKYEVEIIFCTLKKNNFFSQLSTTNVSLDWYEQLLRDITGRFPQVNVHGFSPP